MDDRLRAWVPELVLGAVVLTLGLWEAVSTTPLGGSRSGLAVVAVLTAAAVAACRRAPAAGLGVAWCLAFLHVGLGSQPLVIELSLVVLMFGAARWGRPPTVVVAGMSILLVPAVGLYTLVGQGYDAVLDSELGQGVRDLYFDTSVGGRAVTLGVVGTVIAAPWLAGLVLRYADRARRSQAEQERTEALRAAAVLESEQAREIARLRDDQARMARDVHDVVGHSLAVILAQAESAQFLPDDDPARLKQTMATIASSARASLQDVRHVLSSPDGAPPPQQPLDTLVDGVRAGGHEVVLRELGTPQPLPPDLEATAYRVLQEMLTNAVKHGRRDEPVFVERHWPDGAFAGELRVEVRNAATGPPAEGGRGLAGMQERLLAVGGRLDVRPREEDGTFTVTAWVPVTTR